jgi:choline dehydrogenase-like flavoprotein
MVSARERPVPAQQTEFAKRPDDGTRGAGWTRRLFANREHRGLGAYRGRGKHQWPQDPQCRRSKLLDGSSSINGVVFVRGRAQDFDTWAQMGNRGWSYAEVLPFFKSMESYAGEGNDALRGREGPLRVTSRRGSRTRPSE